LVTGHTGFKGAWLCLWLERLGAKVAALALPPHTDPNLHSLAGPWTGQDHAIVDIRDRAAMRASIERVRPQIIFHLAAQALVRASYREPVETFATNVMGTLHILDAVRGQGSVEAVVAVTTDKVYANDSGGRAFVETDRLGGKDPYSSSKACMELAVQSFRDTLFADGRGPAVATARAGNVVGGGDWSEDRLIPDVMRALASGRSVSLRYPESVRPWQHVLEPLHGYLALAERLLTTPDSAPTAVNFGPDPKNFITVARVVEMLGAAFDDAVRWERAGGPHPPEAATLVLDSTLARQTLGWAPKLSIEETIGWTAEWYRGWRQGADLRRLTLDQIARYEGLCAQGPKDCR
jgi:CDP-glucose 4,6-dehydratase